MLNWLCTLGKYLPKVPEEIGIINSSNLTNRNTFSNPRGRWLPLATGIFIFAGLAGTLWALSSAWANDSDRDGWSDEEEILAGTNPFDETDPWDSDGTPGITQTYDALGRIVSTADASGTTMFAYDAYGAKISEAVSGVNKTIARYYDRFGRGTGYSIGGVRKTPARLRCGERAFGRDGRGKR